MNARHGMTRRELMQWSAAAGLAAVVQARGRTAHGQATLRAVTIGHSVNTFVYAPHLVAIERGTFKQRGLNVTLLVPGGGARVMQAVAGDQVKFGFGDSGHPILLTQKGRPCKMLFGTDTRCSYANIVVRKELWEQGLNTVEKLATLRREDGAPRVIAATAIGSGTWVYGNFVLSQFSVNGKTVNDQVKWVGGGDSSIMLGGLKSGQFDAIMAVPEWIDAATQQGFGTALYDVTSTEAWMRVFKGNVPASVGFALKSALDDDPGMTQDYVSAMYAAMQWMKGRNPEEIYDLIGLKYMSTFKKEAVIKSVKYYQAIFNYGLVVSKADFENTRRVMIPWQTKEDFSFEDIADMRFAEQAHNA